MKRQYLYVYRTRRPSGWWTHNGYAGITNSPWHRDVQHRASQPWSDLIVRRYCWSIGRMPRGLGLLLEWLLIKVTMPVYNVQHNRANPRRIKPADARAQRAARDAGRRSWHLTSTPIIVLCAIVALIVFTWSM